MPRCVSKTRDPLTELQEDLLPVFFDSTDTALLTKTGTMAPIIIFQCTPISPGSLERSYIADLSTEGLLDLSLLLDLLASAVGIYISVGFAHTASHPQCR